MIRDERGAAMAAMSDDEIRAHIYGLWIVVWVLIFIGSTRNLSFLELTERVGALEQVQTSEAQR